MTETRITCPGCGRLLGKRTESGQVEVGRRGTAVAEIAEGRLYCAPCRVWVEVAHRRRKPEFRVLER